MSRRLTDRVGGGTSRTNCGSDRVLCKRLEKTQPSQFPQVQEGACGKSVGRQVKVHEPPVAAKCLLQSAGIRRTGFYLNPHAKSLQRAPSLGKGASRRDAFSAQGEVVAVRGS